MITGFNFLKIIKFVIRGRGFKFQRLRVLTKQGFLSGGISFSGAHTMPGSSLSGTTGEINCLLV